MGMINTGLSLAKQKKENSYENSNSPSINPRSKSPSMQMPWNSQQGNSNKQDFTSYSSGSQFSNSQPSYSNNQQQKTNFNPSKLISQNKLEGKVSRERLADNFLGNKDISSNMIDTDQIHIIGPNLRNDAEWVQSYWKSPKLYSYKQLWFASEYEEI